MAETTQTFEEYIRQTNPTPDTIARVAHDYIKERAEQISVEEMQKAIVESEQERGNAQAEQAVDTAIQKLKDDELAQANIALVALSWAWNDPVQAKRIRESFEQGKAPKIAPILPIVIAVVCMYGMYLAATRGIDKRTTVVQRDEQGNTTTTTIVQNQSFPATIAAVLKGLQFWA